MRGSVSWAIRSRSFWLTPAIDAGRPPLVFGRVHPDHCRNHADADRLEAFEPDLTIAKGLHRRHRVGLTGRPPDFLRFGIARDAEVASYFVVVGRDVLIRDRPVMRAVMLALDLKIVRQQARKVGKVSAEIRRQWASAVCASCVSKLGGPASERLPTLLPARSRTTSHQKAGV